MNLLAVFTIIMMWTSSGTPKPKTVINCAAEQNLPDLAVVGKGNDIKVSGPCKKLADILAEKMNIEFNYSRPEDRSYGIKLKDGNWTGMLGMVQRGEADFAIGPWARNRERSFLVDFTESYRVGTMELILVRPKVENDIFSFIYALTPEVYGLIGIALVIVSLMFSLVKYLEFKMKKRTKLVEPFADSLVWAAQTLLLEGTERNVRTSGSRILIGTWLISTLVFMKSYEGVLTGMFAYPSIDIKVDSIEDLVSYGKLPWKFPSKSYPYSYFQTGKSEVQKKIFNGVSGYFTDFCRNSCDDIAEGKYAGICPEPISRICLNNEWKKNRKCRLYTTRKPAISPLIIVFLAKKKFPYMNEVNRWIAKIREGGFYGKWLNDAIGRKTPCWSHPSADMNKSQYGLLNLENISGVFYLLLIGYVLGLMALIVELVSHYCKSRFFGSNSETLAVAFRQ